MSDENIVSIQDWLRWMGSWSHPPERQKLNEAADEIDRLRAELDVATKNLAGWENMRESYYHLEGLLAERDKRIAELEAYRNEDADTIVTMAREIRDSAKITEDQIDRAWEWYHEDCHRGMYSYLDNGFVFLNTVAMLGIQDCPECGGDGEIQEGVGYPSSDGGEEWQLACCPACHRNGKSHGWVWRNDE